MSNTIVNTLNIFNDEIMITDTSTLISYSGKCKNEYLNQNVNIEFFKLLESRKKYVEEKNIINITNIDIKKSYIIEPLILNGDLIGSLILLSNNSITKEKEKLVDFASKILINYIEE